MLDRFDKSATRNSDGFRGSFTKIPGPNGRPVVKVKFGTADNQSVEFVGRKIIQADTKAFAVYCRTVRELDIARRIPLD